MKASIGGAGGEFRPSPMDGRKKGSGEVKFESPYGGVKSKENPLSITKDQRPSSSNKPGSTRWPMGEGNVKENVKKSR